MKNMISLALLIISGTALAGNWKLKTTTDVMTDQVSSQAFVTSLDGDKFTALRRNDGSVWGYVQLSGMRQFSINENLMVRIDKHNPREFNDKLEKLVMKLGSPMKFWEWNPSLIGFRMWHGTVNAGCGIVRELFEGQQMIVRYHPNQSTMIDITFPLTGNQKALSDALGFDISTCPQGKT
jgi:hypothetical protein